MSVLPRVRRPSFGDTPTAPIPLYLPVTFLVLGLVFFVALTILMIGARSPYTHGNLAAGYDARYDRTEQILVGGSTDFAGLGPSVADPRDAPAVRGASLYVSAGCGTCHGLAGRGGVVGPEIAGARLEALIQRSRAGLGGMPKFSSEALTDAQLADIAAYLASVVTPK